MPVSGSGEMEMEDVRGVGEGARLAALRRTDLLDLEPEEAFDEITELAATLCEAPVSLISLLDGGRQWIKSAFGVSCGETGRRDSVCAVTIEEDSTLVVPDLLADARFRDTLTVQEEIGLRSYAGVPIRGLQGQRLGALCVMDRVPREFTEKQMRGLRSLARQVEAQIALRGEMRERAALVRELESSRLRFEAFMDHSPVAAFIKDEDGRMCWYNQRLAEMYGVTTEMWLGRTDEEIWPGEMAASFRRTDRAVLEQGTELLLEETSPRPDGGVLYWRTCKFGFTDAGGTRYLAGVSVDLTREKEQQAELRRITQKLTRTNSELTTLSMIDPLTAIGNRRAFDLALEQGCAAAEEGEGRLSLIMLDIDHFKKLNDKHGHGYGDEVLVGVARLLRRLVRATDHVCRYGGEEFAVLLPGAGAAPALDLARRLCAAVRGVAWPHGPVTISAGVATFAELALTGRTDAGVVLTESADLALYAAKRGGRNRVVAAGSEARETTLRERRMGAESADKRGNALQGQQMAIAFAAG